MQPHRRSPVPFDQRSKGVRVSVQAALHEAPVWFVDEAIPSPSPFRHGSAGVRDKKSGDHLRGGVAYAWPVCHSKRWKADKPGVIGQGDAVGGESGQRGFASRQTSMNSSTTAAMLASMAVGTAAAFVANASLPTYVLLAAT